MAYYYDSLQDTLDSVPNRDIKVVMREMNAKMGLSQQHTTAYGWFGLGERNERGEDFIEFGSRNNLAITNTMFKHHPRHLYTWTSPDKKARNQIDFIMTGLSIYVEINIRHRKL